MFTAGIYHSGGEDRGLFPGSVCAVVTFRSTNGEDLDCAGISPTVNIALVAAVEIIHVGHSNTECSRAKAHIPGKLRSHWQSFNV